MEVIVYSPYDDHEEAMVADWLSQSPGPFNVTQMSKSVRDPKTPSRSAVFLLVANAMVRHKWASFRDLPHQIKSGRRVYAFVGLQRIYGKNKEPVFEPDVNTQQGAKLSKILQDFKKITGEKAPIVPCDPESENNDGNRAALVERLREMTHAVGPPVAGDPIPRPSPPKSSPGSQEGSLAILKQTKEIMGEIRAGLPELRHTISTNGQELRNTLDTVDVTLKKSQPVLDRLLKETMPAAAKTLDEINAGLPELRHTISTNGRTMNKTLEVVNQRLEQFQSLDEVQKLVVEVRHLAETLQSVTTDVRYVTSQFKPQKVQEGPSALERADNILKQTKDIVDNISPHVDRYLKIKEEEKKNSQIPRYELGMLYFGTALLVTYINLLLNGGTTSLEPIKLVRYAWLTLTIPTFVVALCAIPYSRNMEDFPTIFGEWFRKEFPSVLWKEAKERWPYIIFWIGVTVLTNHWLVDWFQALLFSTN